MKGREQLAHDTASMLLHKVGAVLGRHKRWKLCLTRRPSYVVCCSPCLLPQLAPEGHPGAGGPLLDWGHVVESLNKVWATACCVR